MLRDRWTLPTLLREAYANTFSWAARLFPVLAVSVVLGAGQSALMTYQAIALDQDLLDLKRSGRNVLVAGPYSDDASTEIQRDSCEGLSMYSQVERVGMLGDIERVDFLELGPMVQVQQVSVSLIPELEDNDSVIGSALWPDTDSVVTLLTPGGRVLSSLVGVEQPQGVPVNSVLAVALDPSVVMGKQCVVVFDSYVSIADMKEIVGAQLEAVGDPLVLSTPFVENVDLVAAHLMRTERYLPIGVAAFGFLAVFLVSKFRSSEFAAYRLSGTSRRSMCILVFLEQLLIAGVYLTSASGTTLVIGWQSRAPGGPILWALLGAAAWVFCAGSAASLVASRRATDMAKDR